MSENIDQQEEIFLLMEESLHIAKEVQSFSKELSFLFVVEEHKLFAFRNKQALYNALTSCNYADLKDKYEDVAFHLCNYMTCFTAVRDFLFNGSKKLSMELKEKIHNLATAWKKTFPHMIINEMRNKYAHGLYLLEGISEIHQTKNHKDGERFIVTIKLYDDAFETLKEAMDKKNFGEDFINIFSSETTKFHFASFLNSAHESLNELIEKCICLYRAEFESKISKHQELMDRYEEIENRLESLGSFKLTF